MAFMNDLRVCESAEGVPWVSASADLCTEWKVSKLRGCGQEEQLTWLWLGKIEVCSDKSL